MLEIVTFTGVDARTDLGRLQEIAAQYPWAEFGILVGSQTYATACHNPIFPAIRTVHELRSRLPSRQLAIHLCGWFARQANKDQWSNLPLMAMSAGFGRIQVNLHGDIEHPHYIRVNTEAMTVVAQDWGADRVIIQHRQDWTSVPVKHPRVEYLFDRSEGGGTESFDSWPAPPSGMRVGYAGGLGPHNIDRAIRFSMQHQDRPIWLDMERNVRTTDYWFDLDRVAHVCRRVEESGATSP